MPMFVTFLLFSAFLTGAAVGEGYQEDRIGNACLTKKEIEIRGHMFQCERTKVKEGL